MAKITVDRPRILTVDYRQERSDPNYGKCLWATFRADLDRYELLITSDCGNYSHGWKPTPNSESFLESLSRMNNEYLLSKIADKTVVDREETERAVKEYLKEVSEDNDVSLADVDMDLIEEACNNEWASSCFEEIVDALDSTWIDDYIDTGWILELISMTEPNGAKTIAEIFKDYIQPEFRKLAAEESNSSIARKEG